MPRLTPTSGNPLPVIRRRWLIVLALFLPAVCPPNPARGADLEVEPINYDKAPADNPVSQLQGRIDTGKVKLDCDPHFGYLPSLLRELKIPRSSQVLVFSKTSFQRNRIGPRTPRALYFNDTTYVGFCQKGKVLEVAAADPGLGAVFYTIDQKTAARPLFARQNDSCLICHGSSQNQGFPGLQVRSVYADAAGLPILTAETFRTDHTSPLSQRWGGWYVTGTSGKQTHMGNRIVRDEDHPEQGNDRSGVNVTDLGKRLQTSNYLTPHSDIVALMVLEHQAEMHNRIARANFLTRLALRDEEVINKALGRPAGQHTESTLSRIKSAGEPLVKYLLFSGEARLTDPIRGTSGFAKEFAAGGPRDVRGRSLRDLDLNRRLFKYPCSYLIYSPGFDALPGPVKDYVLRRVWEVLTGKDTSPDFAHLSAADRRAIREIMVDTKPNLPAYWKSQP